MKGLSNLVALIAAFSLAATACGDHKAKPDAPIATPAAAETETKTETPAPAPTDPLVVRTDRGDVRARSVTDSIALFSDVPYAAPPVGPSRWKPPAPHEPWTGVFEPPKFEGGIVCPATMIPSDAAFGAAPGESEDCLYLDVYAPEKRPSSPLPVLFYLHGGFGQFGSKGVMDGTALAKFGNVIFVAANYRLGALGYLAHPALTAEQGSSGNYAHLDQIAALQWVKDNIAKFGGDPNRVTLSGFSWGGQSTCVLLASPLAKGLFSRAISISAPGCRTFDQAAAFAGGQAFAGTLHCSETNDVLGCLRSKSPKDLSGAAPAQFWSRDYRWYSVVDDHVLPDKARSIIGTGAYNRVPVVIGNTSEEVEFLKAYVFPPVGVASANWTAAEYETAVQRIFGNSAPQILARYPVSDFSGSKAAEKAMTALLTDQRFLCSNRRVARAIAAHQTEPVYRYLFDFAPILNGHGIDLTFAFRGAHDQLDSPAVRQTEDDIGGYLTRFVASGDPNGSGALAWPIYDGTRDEALAFDKPVRTTSGFHSAQCDFWDTLASDP